ncbi:MAG: CHRD domain-containing protein [Gammaproteobacteria bacterium]|nr:CHRD domain-containing protein [Gammaproteobacteria bacterium]
MNKKHIFSIVTAAALSLSAPTYAALLHYQAALTGYQEVSAPNQFGNGAADGFGVADLVIDTTALTIDWNFMIANIALPLTGAHIHQNIAGQNGPVVVNFSAQLSGSGLIDADLANIIANPKNFYVNLHNAEFPNGAIRGQLGDALPTAVPLPAAFWLLGSGLLGLFGINRIRK